MDVLYELREINPVRYHFDEEIGLIAQEVKVHSPKLASEKSDDTLSFTYSNFTTVLLKGMQEQQSEIAEELPRKLFYMKYML